MGAALTTIHRDDWVGVRKNFQRIKSILFGPDSTPTFAGATLSGLTSNSLLYSVSGVITSLGVATDGQFPIGSTGAAPVLATLTGTANQLTIANASGSITLSTPQDTHTGATMTLSGLLPATTETYDLGAFTAGSTVGSPIGLALALTYTSGAGTNDRWRHLYLSGNLSDGTNVVTIANCKTAFDHVTESGASHSYIDQDVTVSASPTFAGLTLSNFLIFDKSSGKGIKVDTATPTFGFADLLGDQFSRNTGGTKPTLSVYNGDVDSWQFSDGDEAYLTYHIPHDYVPGTDIHLHVHWSQNNTGATGGTIDFKYFAIYAKGHNQASGSTFTSTPITATFSSIDINDGAAGLSRYQQHLTEVTISAASATAALFDRDDFEPDGIIELTLEMDADNLTGTPSDPFIHHADIHYQTTGLIGTKSRTPDFYA